jgi:hypothetical protein
MQKIPLNHGFVTLVDDEDFDWLTAIGKWHVEFRGIRMYARHRSGYMHRIIMNRPALDVDHHDGDGLNNRRSNLRVATRSANMLNPNVTRRLDNKSGKTGVHFDTFYKGWKAEIKVNGKKYHLGVHDTLDAAIAARLVAEQRIATGLSPKE